MTPKQIEEGFEELRARVTLLEELLAGGKARGPKSERPMTELDAFRVKFGDLRKELKNHKEAAAATGLSYGQIFSCRGGYTFKHVKADWKPPVEPKPTEAAK